jgi:hypothetical protein
MKSPDFDQLKNSKIPKTQLGFDRGRDQDIKKHCLKVYKNFANKSELEFFHAYLIVHIRREIEIEWCVKNFYLLWEKEITFLCNKLSSRWLVSACDTIIDHPNNTVNQALCIAGSLFINTIKLYETENLMLADKSYQKNDPSLMEEKLIDGLTPYAVGRGDMIINMFRRINGCENKDEIGFKILKELIKRMHTHDSVYRRMAEKHTNPKTIWSNLL